MTVQLGMFSPPVARPDKPYGTLLQETKDAIVLADRLGFSEYFIGEHHTSLLERITSPLMLLASVADRTTNIRLGTGVINLPLMHPVAVASNVAMFDHLCGGRFIMGVGPGSLYSDCEAFGLEQADVRGRMMYESVDIVQQLWSREPPLDIKGEFWNVSLNKTLWPEFKVGWVPRPLQQPHPPIAVALVTPESSTARQAGRRGWIPISSNFINKRYLRKHWEIYAAGCEDAGRRPDPQVWRVARCCLVTKTDAEAEDYLSDESTSLRYYYHFFRFNLSKGRGALFMLKPDTNASDESATEEAITRAQVIAGSPRRVLEQLVALREEIGHFGTLTVTGHDWDKPQLWKTSMELMANEVMTRFNAHADVVTSA